LHRYHHIRELRCIRPYLDFKTASTIATSIVHSKLDYCNSLYHKLPNCQLYQLQQIQNSLARAVVKAPKSTHVILKFLHWLKVNKRIEFKLLCLWICVESLSSSMSNSRRGPLRHASSMATADGTSPEFHWYSMSSQIATNVLSLSVL